MVKTESVICKTHLSITREQILRMKFGFKESRKVTISADMHIYQSSQAKQLVSRQLKLLTVKNLFGRCQYEIGTRTRSWSKQTLVSRLRVALCHPHCMYRARRQFTRKKLNQRNILSFQSFLVINCQSDFYFQFIILHHLKLFFSYFAIIIVISELSVWIKTVSRLHSRSLALRFIKAASQN